MKRTNNIVLRLAFFLAIISFSCEKDGKHNPAGPSADTENFPLSKVTVTLALPSESTVQAADHRIVSFADEVPISGKGTAAVSMPEVDNNQLVFVTSAVSGNPVFLGIRCPMMNAIEIGVNSTALGLTLLNPYLIGADASVCDEYMSAVLINPKFDELLALLTDAYRSDGETALDYETNPEILSLAVGLMAEAGVSLGLGVSTESGLYPSPYVEHAAGDTITIGNPTPVWYGAGIYTGEKTLNNVVTVPRTDVTSATGTFETETDYSVGNGYHEIIVTKGCDYSKLADWNDPKGRATALNTAQAIVCIIEIGTGDIPCFNETLAEAFPSAINLTVRDVGAIYDMLSMGSALDLFAALVNVIEHNGSRISGWLRQEDSNGGGTKTGDATWQYIDCLSGIFDDMTPLFDTAGWPGERVPFLWDMQQAPEEAVYHIMLEESDIISWDRKITASGRVLENDSGLSGVSIHISGENTYKTVITDTNGAYYFRLLDAGSYTFAITKSNYRFSYSIFKIDIENTDITLPDITATQTGGTGGGVPHDIEGIAFVTIPGGSFQMGAVEGGGYPDEHPVHFVTLDGFEMSACEITYAQYGAFLNDALASGDITISSEGVAGLYGEFTYDFIYMDTSDIVSVDSESGIGYDDGSIIFPAEILNHPVTHVSWFGAKVFAQYYGFDLPTEAEWEYAARGGKQHKYGTNDGSMTRQLADDHRTWIRNYAEISFNVDTTITPIDVGSFPPNPFGLYDMCGNVMEWCDDGYDSDFYARSPSVNPKGSGSYKVIRDRYRAAERDYTKTQSCGRNLGFRVVRRP